MSYDNWLLGNDIPLVMFGKLAYAHNTLLKGRYYIVKEEPNFAYSINNENIPAFLFHSSMPHIERIPRSGTVTTKGSFYTLEGQVCTYLIKGTSVYLNRPDFKDQKAPFSMDGFMEIAEKIHGRT